jgi:uncharacterized LabA/DUF88 family protein
MSRHAVLLDGGFVTKRLQSRLRRFPVAEDIVSECRRIAAHSALAGSTLLRNHFYDARPAIGLVTNPLDGTTVNLSRTEQFERFHALHDSLELMPDFALRMGEVVVRGWRIDDHGVRDLARTKRLPCATDARLSLMQKGVDLRIGLDIARLALRRLVDTLVIVTGDSDLVPAFRFARREGLRVYLDLMGHPSVRRELRAHVDLVL